MAPDSRFSSRFPLHSTAVASCDYQVKSEAYNGAVWWASDALMNAIIVVPHQITSTLRVDIHPIYASYEIASCFVEMLWETICRDLKHKEE